MMQHVEFNRFKTNGTYLVFGIYTELKSNSGVRFCKSHRVKPPFPTTPE